MLTWNRWICSPLLVCPIISPAVAESKDSGEAKPKGETATPATVQVAPGARSNVVPLNNSESLTALLGVLVMKGVLTSGEANAIRNASSDAEFRMLVDALARRGIVAVTDLAPLAPPSAAVKEAAPASNP